MGEPLRVVHLEDSLSDAELVQSALAKAGLDCSITRVENRERFGAAINSPIVPHVILADYNLPGFTGLEALDLVKEVAPAVPFIFVTGTLGEERAVEALRRGATDFVLKHRLELLGYAVSRALDEVRVRREREAAVEALRRSEEQFRVAFESAPIGMALVAPDFRCVRVNRALCAMLGYSERELCQRTFLDITFPDDRREDASLATRLFRGEIPEYRMEKRYVARDGTIVWGALTATLVTLDGEVTGLGMVEDITARKRAEEARDAFEAQLWEAQKMEALGQFTGGIAHDFNNILTVIRASAELVSGGLRPDQRELREDLDAVIQASDRGKDLIAKLMTFSRREPLTMLSIDLTALVSEAGQALRRMLPDNVEVTVEVEPGPISVSADAGALHQILLNFGTNARDAMPGGGSFTITLRRVSVGEIQASVHGLPGGAYARLDARDTGQGMDEATRRRVFEPLFTTKPPGKGTGLGLATVYGLVKQHRGFVEVASDVGRGTTFSVYLPLLRPEAEPVAEQVAAVRVPVRGGKETVLIAEDEEGIRRAAQRALEKLGYRVLIAADGEKALELCRRHRGEIALVVSDNSMPRITGEQLLSTLRGEGDEVRFLLVSGLESQPGATQYPRVRSITKPWTLEELARAVRAALDA